MKPLRSNSTDYTRAMLNILEDFSQEKRRLEEMQRAVINIIEDSAEEKGRLEGTQRAAFNILEDFAAEKARLEDTQRAMLNLLEDFDVERAKTEAANRELRQSLEALRTAKDATETVNREIEAFSYSVSHDLRTPLRSIDGFSLALLEDYAGTLDDTGKNYLRRVRNATIRMGQLIDDLLRLSRLTRSEMNREWTDLSAVVRTLFDNLRKLHPARPAEAIVQDGLVAHCDGRLMAIALENLVSNAWKFSEKVPRTVIEFGAVEKNGIRSFFVKDNGTGFDMNYAGKLFNPFQRLHKTDEFPGTGIGLATVKRIINRHGGQVWIEAVEDKGATVYFTLG